jgi:hypothetical protein
MTMMVLLADFSGWVGAVFVLAGYTAFSLGWITNGWVFQTCNLIGSGALIFNGYHNQAWPFVVLNSIWATIAAAALFRLQRSKPAAVKKESGEDVLQ